MYVALTGTTTPVSYFGQSRMLHGQNRYNIPSRFLHEFRIVAHGANDAKARYEWMGRGKQVADDPGAWYAFKLAPRYSGFSAVSMRMDRIGFTPSWRGVIVNCEVRADAARVEVRFGAWARSGYC